MIINQIGWNNDSSSSGKIIKKIGTVNISNEYIDCTSIPNYDKLTLDNFILGYNSFSMCVLLIGGTTIPETISETSYLREPHKEYNQSTGQLFITWLDSKQWQSDGKYQIQAWINDIDVYVVYNGSPASTIRVLLHGGRNETISDDNGNSWTTDNTCQILAEVTVGTSYTFTGGLSGYSRTVTIEESTTDVYVRPENIVYWYGDKCEDITGGWTHSGTGSLSVGDEYIDLYWSESASYGKPNNSIEITGTAFYINAVQVPGVSAGAYEQNTSISLSSSSTSLCSIYANLWSYSTRSAAISSEYVGKSGNITLTGQWYMSKNGHLRVKGIWFE